MKTTICIKDNINHTVIKHQVTTPNKLHFDIQRNTRANVFRDKTKYTRKEKHRTIFAY